MQLTCLKKTKQTKRTQNKSTKKRKKLNQPKKPPNHQQSKLIWLVPALETAEVLCSEMLQPPV